MIIDSIKDEYERSCYLVVSYFDRVIGPMIFYSNARKDQIQQMELVRVIDFSANDQAIIFAFNDYQNINYLFSIDSDKARGGYEQMMVSYIVRVQDFEGKSIDVFKYLKAKQPILTHFSDEIKRFKWLPSILYKKKNISPEKDYVLDLVQKEYKDQFLKTFTQYFKRLSSIFKRFENDSRRRFTSKCPICGQEGVLSLPASRVNRDGEKTLIVIPRFMVCNHSYSQEIDEALNCYKYQKVDIVISEIEIEKIDVQEIDMILVHNILEYLEKNKNEHYIFPKKVIKYIYDILNVKINKDYLFYLAEFVKDCFNREINWAKDQVLEKFETLWPD